MNDAESMTGGNAPGSRLWVLVLLLLVALAGAFAVWLSAHPRRSPASSFGPEDTACNSAPAVNVPLNKPATTPDIEQPPIAGCTPAAPELLTVKLLFHLADGAAVPNVRFLSYDEKLQSRLDQADAAGLASVKARPNSIVCIEVYNWRETRTREGVEHRTRDYDYAWWSERTIIRVETRSCDANVLVHPAASVRVDARYADGTPWCGGVSIRSGSMSRGIAFDERSPVEIQGVPQDLELQLFFPEVRVGYSRLETSISTDDLKRGSVVEIVIPVNDIATGSLAISCEAPGAESFLFRIRAMNGPCPNSFYDLGNLAGRGLFRSPPLPAGKYELVVLCVGTESSGKETVRRTPVLAVEVRKGEETQVFPLLESTGALRLQIVDVDDKPISGAVVQVDDGTTPSLFRSKEIPGFKALSGPDGVVRLSCLTLSKSRFCVEAAGYEPSFIDASVSSDETDAGKIRLRKAQGRVVVILTGFRKNAVYVGFVGVVGSLRGSYLAYLPVADNRLEISGLPSKRRYWIGVGLESGGKIESVEVSLEGENTFATAELDVSAIDED